MSLPPVMDSADGIHLIFSSSISSALGAVRHRYRHRLFHVDGASHRSCRVIAVTRALRRRREDYIFIATAVVVQPLSSARRSSRHHRLVVARRGVAVIVAAGALRARRAVLAAVGFHPDLACAIWPRRPPSSREPLPPLYYRCSRHLVLAGWPAFLGVLGIVV